MIGAGNDRQFGILCECLGRRDVLQDERFATNEGRVRNREGLVGIIQEEIGRRRTGEWLDVFEGKGMPYAAIKYLSPRRNPPHHGFSLPHADLNAFFETTNS